MTPDIAASPASSSMLERAYQFRVYLLCAVIFAVMSLLAPRFLTQENLSAILKGTSTNIYAAIGFTIVLICGQLDLSVGATMTLGAMVAVALQPRFGWAGSVPVAMLCGLIVGFVNGVLVAKARINSFIVTLGTMTILGGVINLLSKGGTLFVNNFSLGDKLDPAGWTLTPRVIISVVVLLLAAGALRFIVQGRSLYLVGGNSQTAWFAGLNVSHHVIAAFIISGVMSAVGGAIFAISLSSANPTMGDKSLMPVIAAVIVGGTSMKGGKGGVIGSAVALLALVMLMNGLSCMGAGFESQQIASGLVLASVVLYDAWQTARETAVRGQRRSLLAELTIEPNEVSEQTEGSLAMRTERKDHSFALACVAIVGCVSVVAIYAMSNRNAAPVAAGNTNIAQTATAAEPDIAALKATDGQPLLAMDDAPLNAPPRPADPSALPEDDALHWYDQEYAGWNVTKTNLPKSRGTGPRGKRVICLRFIDHPYLTAYTRGMQKVADAYSIQLKTLVANNDINIQAQQVDQAINERPDLVIITPVDATAVVPLLRKLYNAGVPVIASNLMPIDQGMPYVLTWTGPDDWGNFRALARDFAKRMNYQGGYCIVRHMPGTSPFFSRTFGMVTELKKIAPKMECLDMQPTGLEAEKTMQVVSDWVTRFGPKLKGIVSADDSGAQIGINEALKNAGREDVIRVAAGNSKVGMDAVKAGTLAAITYQSPESDGAVPMKLADDWFSGKAIERPVYYLKKQLITKDNVDSFLPAQW
jgi:ribose/xylose/arabinose/galactoside ABC-type transport system permease subunit/ABC-type sugar transport system substrate-binding protein